MSGDHGAEKLQKRTLLIVLVLNFSLFVALGVGGVRLWDGLEGVEVSWLVVDEQDVDRGARHR